MTTYHVNPEELTRVAAFIANGEPRLKEASLQLQNAMNQFNADLVWVGKEEINEEVNVILGDLQFAADQMGELRALMLKLLEQVNKADNLIGNANILGTPGATNPGNPNILRTPENEF